MADFDDEKIVALHPDPKKKPVNINRAKYETVKGAIMSTLRKNQLTHAELNNIIKSKLKKNFDGSVPWYVETVKLDLEARGLIERDKQGKPPVYRLRK